MTKRDRQAWEEVEVGDGTVTRLRERIEELEKCHRIVCDANREVLDELERVRAQLAEAQEDSESRLTMLDRIVAALEVLGYRPDDYGGTQDVVDAIQDLGTKLAAAQEDREQLRAVLQAVEVFRKSPPISAVTHAGWVAINVLLTAIDDVMGTVRREEKSDGHHSDV